MHTAAVQTQMRFAASPEHVWRGLLFYEQIEERPPLYLRLLLPVPIGTEGADMNVGAEVRCSYHGGSIVKRITQLDKDRHYGFEIVDQTLAIGGGVTLLGGCYTLDALPGGGTNVAAMTRYVSPRRPSWLCKPIEMAVCHLFHRYLLAAMRRKVDAR